MKPSLKKGPVRFPIIINESQVRRALNEGESKLNIDRVRFPIIINESQVRRAQNDGES